MAPAEHTLWLAPHPPTPPSWYRGVLGGPGLCCGLVVITSRLTPISSPPQLAEATHGRPRGEAGRTESSPETATPRQQHGAHGEEGDLFQVHRHSQTESPSFIVRPTPPQGPSRVYRTL